MASFEIPKFETESEEVAWWEANRQRVSEEFAQAGREGRLRRRPPADGTQEKLPLLDLTDDQMLELQEAAHRRRMSFSAYVTLLVREGLERDKAA